MTPLPRSRHGIFILLRRLRAPLTSLIVVYAVAVVGFTLITGIDPDGRSWAMSFLQAFYFVSFLGTTIGLGEIPYPFTDTQRLWATATIYSTVIAWLYAIGALFSILQDPLFRRVIQENALDRAVRRLTEPFYLICGYDDSSSRVARELSEEGVRAVVVDSNGERADSVEVEEIAADVPALQGDASDPKTLVMAGLTHKNCIGVLALTGDDSINTKIALTARLLNPSVPVLCAVHDHLSHARMAAAGAEYLINPNDTFAERVAMSLRAPSMHVIYESLTTQRGTAMDKPITLPRGRWIICGFDLFGRALRRQLIRLGIETVVVHADQNGDFDADNSVHGDPTDPAVLRRAGIEGAAAIVAGTRVDIDNLAITLAARGMNKHAFIVARQLQRRNGAVYRASPADLVVLSGYVVAAEVMRVIRAPQLATFLRLARDQEESWASALLLQMREVIGEDVVESWSIDVTPLTAQAICAALEHGEPVTVQRLINP
ncbi:MAG: NAD(P)-binding protein, partial [Casimicrobium sp.]